MWFSCKPVLIWINHMLSVLIFLLCKYDPLRGKWAHCLSSFIFHVAVLYRLCYLSTCMYSYATLIIRTAFLHLSIKWCKSENLINVIISLHFWEGKWQSELGYGDIFISYRMYNRTYKNWQFNTPLERWFCFFLLHCFSLYTQIYVCALDMYNHMMK